MAETNTRMADRIEIWPVGKLVPYDKNPRTHSTEQVNQIAASIAEFGFLNPILVDTTAGIIAGHGRLQAAIVAQVICASRTARIASGALICPLSTRASTGSTASRAPGIFRSASCARI